MTMHSGRSNKLYHWSPDPIPDCITITEKSNKVYHEIFVLSYFIKGILLLETKKFDRTTK